MEIIYVHLCLCSLYCKTFSNTYHMYIHAIYVYARYVTYLFSSYHILYLQMINISTVISSTHFHGNIEKYLSNLWEISMHRYLISTCIYCIWLNIQNYHVPDLQKLQLCQFLYATYKLRILLLANDIETNPGPVNERIISYVKASTHQGDTSVFTPTSAGKQCVPNSIMAIIYSKIVPLQSWESHDLDVILYNGNKLYNKINSPDDFLLINDLPDTVTEFGMHYTIMKGQEKFGILTENNITNIGEDINSALCSMIQDMATCAIMCIGYTPLSYASVGLHGGSASALIITKTKCYIFDPHSRNEDGKPGEHGTAILLIFETIKQCSLYIKDLASRLNCNYYEITIMNINKMVPEKDIQNCTENEVEKMINFTTDRLFKDTDKKLTKRERDKLKKEKNRIRMRNKREETEYKAIEKERNTNFKIQDRMHSEVKKKEMEHKRQKRSDPLIMKKEVESMRKKRADPRIKEQEAEQKRQKRSDPLIMKKEVESMRKKRADPRIKEQEAEQKRQKRSDPLIMKKEVENKRKKRADPTIKEQEAEQKRQKRSDPLIMKKEVESMRKKRADPRIKEQEAEQKRQKRNDPLIMKKEVESMRKKREDPTMKEQEAEHKRQKRSDPLIMKKEVETMRKKREDPIMKEHEAKQMRQKRTDPLFRKKESGYQKKRRSDPIVRENDVNSTRQKRTNDKVKEKNRQYMRKKRTSGSDYSKIEANKNTNRMKSLRASKEYTDKEIKQKKLRRQDPTYKNRETVHNTCLKQHSRLNKAAFHTEKCNVDRKRYGSNLTELLLIFNDSIAEGPIYVCTCCQQIWFRHSVYNVQEIRLKSDSERKMYDACSTRYISRNGKEWICKTCRNAIKDGKIPKMSLKNKMGFPRLPPELQLHPMEERLIALRIVFMLLRDHPVGGQTFARGNFVNIPINIAPTVNTLPRTFTESEIVTIKFKRKKQYKRCEFKENIRPVAVWKALHYLLMESQLYKDANIQVDTSWLSQINISQDGDDEISDIDETNQKTVINANSPKYISGKDKTCDDESINFSEDEDNFETCAIDMDTMLDDNDPILPQSDEPVTAQEMTFAPGEGQIPLSVFKDENAEYLAFPSIFCGQKRPDNSERSHIVHYSDICKYELRCVDRRVASNIPNIFFKLKRLQIKQVCDKVTLAVRRFKTKGKKLKVKDILDDTERQRLINLDEGFYIFRTIRNSPAYLEKRKKDAFAMIRQLGFPSLFISQSCAETKWPELLRSLGQLQDNKTYTDEEIEGMDWQTKCRLIKGDSPTVVRYFEHRFLQFFNLVIKSPHKPIHEVTDYFMRMEFAGRGTIHIHWFAYLKNAPDFGHSDTTVVADYYDQIISCSSDVPENYKKYIEYQLHRHSKTCRIGNTHKCRFSFPVPPMRKTVILEPIEYESEEEETLLKQKWRKINKHLSDYGMALDLSTTFDEMLAELQLTEEEYINSVRSTLVRPKFFLKRKPCEIRINNYMKNCFQFWRANHDIQPSLTPYAMVEYMLAYVTKAQKGMSIIMDKACKEARSGNMEIKQSVRHMGNAFLNAVETSQQEAAFLVLQMAVTRMSRETLFLPTSPPNDRTYLLKDYATLNTMDPESCDIQTHNIFTHYQQRPRLLEDYCLANFAADLRIVYPKDVTFPDPFDDNFDDDFPDEHNIFADKDMVTLKNGIKIQKRRLPRILRYVNYNVKRDKENYFRERLMLFLPWRNEDLYGGCKTYEAHYKIKHHLIEHTRRKYENYSDILDETIEQVENQELDEIYGDLETDLDKDGQSDKDQYGFYDPDRPEKHRYYDIGQDLGLREKYITEVDMSPCHMGDQEYLLLMQSLNLRQSEICTHVMQWIQTKTEKLHIFIEGGAGVGKTMAAKAICESMNRFYRTQPGSNPDQMQSIVLAPTGMAAYQVNGNTIHSGLHIPINQQRLPPLGSSELNTLRSKYIGAKAVYYDEVSMIGRTLWNKSDKRLKEIFGTQKDFGGLHVIAVGDFFQLPPVRDSYVFKDDNKDYGPLATNLWKKHIHIYTLSEIMRQRGEKEFCEILNRLRTGNLTENDNSVFVSRTVQRTDINYISSARHFFPLNITAKKHNEYIYMNSNTVKMNILAYDFVTGNPSEKAKEKARLFVSTSSKYSDVLGLLRNLKAAVGLPYTISVNIKTDDGLINGAACILKKIHFLSETNKNVPSILWVTFHHEAIGHKWKKIYTKYYAKDIPNNWIPIFAIDRQFQTTNARVIRTQFPLKPAGGTTIHSSQGCTFDKICISMDISDSDGLTRNENLARLFLQHSNYVAASRVTSLEGLQILSWNPKLISVNNDVKEHMEYLYNERQVQLCYTPVYRMEGLKCCFLNTRSLHKNYRNIKTNHNISASDILFFAETRLISSDESNNYKIDGFKIVCRNDQHWTKESRPSHGLICFVKELIRVLDVQKISSSVFEAILVCVQHPQLPIAVQLIGIYVSPQCQFTKLKWQLDQIMKDIDITCSITILGDFNMKSITGLKQGYNHKLEQYMKKQFNLNQVIKEDTSNYASVLDLCFTNINIQTSTIWNYWSDHRILAVALP